MSDPRDNGPWVQAPGDNHHSYMPGLKHFSYHSDCLGREVGYCVVLPDDYDSSDRRYPVVYSLHGGGGTELTHLLTANVWRQLAADGNIEPIIFVCHHAYRSSYMDHHGDRIRAESMFTTELVPRIDQQFRTLADGRHRAVHGFSMGATGAVQFAVKFPDLFHSAAAFGGAAVDLENTDNQWVLDILAKHFGPDEWRYRENNPFHFIRENGERLRQNDAAFLFVCGDADSWFETAVDTQTALHQQQLRCELVSVPDVGHNFTQLMMAEGVAVARFQDAFFRGV